MPIDASVYHSESTLTSQIVQRILSSAKSGHYHAAQRLPSERDLAEQLTVSRNTVTAAYAELEQLGVIRRIQGKGAFLCAAPEQGESFSWSGKVSRYANALDEPVLELLANRCASDLRFPFSAGTPSLEIFSEELYGECVNRVLQGGLTQAVAMAPTEGQWALRSALGRWLGVSAQNVMITAGAQEGIDLIARCLIEPGDALVIDAPTYPGAIQSFVSAGARLLPWGTDWSLPYLEELLLRHRPKAIFTTPTFQNPTGRVMSLKTREGLLALARRYRVPVIEDDVYSRTYFGEQPMPESLQQQDQHSQVISISTFSKMLAPGLRIGWLTAPLYMIKQLSLIKMRSNLFTCGLSQLALTAFLERGYMDRHLATLRAHHAAMCADAMAALEPAIHAGCLRCRVPAGGLYLWCKLSDPDLMEPLLAALEDKGVSVAPGAAFDPERRSGAHAYLRLCFTAVPRARLQEGLKLINQTVLRVCQPCAGGSSQQ